MCFLCVVNRRLYLGQEWPSTLLGSFRCEAFVEDFFDILHRVHAQQQGHLGYKKTLAEVWNIFTCQYMYIIILRISFCRSLLVTSVFLSQRYSGSWICVIYVACRNLRETRHLSSRLFHLDSWLVDRYNSVTVKERVQGLVMYHFFFVRPGRIIFVVEYQCQHVP